MFLYSSKVKVKKIIWNLKKNNISCELEILNFNLNFSKFAKKKGRTAILPTIKKNTLGVI